MLLFEEHGDEGIYRFINDKIVPLLYNEGTSTEIIRLPEYTKWKKTMVPVGS